MTTPYSGEKHASGLPTRSNLWSAGALMVFTTAIVLGTAAIVWNAGGEKAQGVAYALIGAAVTHLMKETRELLRRIEISDG